MTPAPLHKISRAAAFSSGKFAAALVIALAVLFCAPPLARAIIISNGENANDVIGQFLPADETTPEYTQSCIDDGDGIGFSLFNGLGSSNPSVIIDSTNHRLFVSDSGNNRVLVFTLTAGNLLSSKTPTYVLGQPDFTTCFDIGTTQSSMGDVDGMDFDATNNRLFVADSYNNRVLVFNTSTITNGMNASYVLGQANFTNGVNGTTQATMNGPVDVKYDSANARLFVADNSNTRVLVFNVATGTIANGENASFELGQPSGTAFTTSTQATTQSGMNFPDALAYDSANTRLYVADSGNNRVLVFNVATGTIANGENASNELGQPSGTAFTSQTANTTQAGMSGPTGLAYDSANTRLFVGEFNNNRVTVFNTSTITNGMNASYVVGEPDFITNSNSTTQAGLNGPTGLTYDSTNRQLYVADQGNNRVMIFPPNITNGDNAIDILGEFSSPSTDTTAVYTKSCTNNGASSIGFNLTTLYEFTKYGYSGSAIDATNHWLFVPDFGNSRVLVFTLTAGNVISSKTPTYVLGQTGYTSCGCQTTQSGMCGPAQLAVDAAGQRLFVADTLNNRVLVFSTASMSSGMNAAHVLGKANFTTYTHTKTQSTMSQPVGLAYDSVNSRLFVAETNNLNNIGDASGFNYTGGGNNRVTVWNVATGSIADGENASNVLGQSTYTTNTAATTQAGMRSPVGLAYDSANTRLFVADDLNNRVTVFNVATGSIANGENASNELGQPSGTAFTTKTAATSVSGMTGPVGLAYDSANTRLFVAEGNNNRVTVFNVATGTIANGENAAHVLGQANFTSGGLNATQPGLYTPAGVAYDSTNNQVYVDDSFNNREMLFSTPPDPVVTAKGTAAVKAQASPWTALSGIALNQGDTLLVCTGTVGTSITGITWNGVALTSTTGNGNGKIYALTNATAGTGNIVVSTSAASTGIAISATAVSGLLISSSLDKTHAAGPTTSTSPSSGATATTTQASEFLYGCVDTNSDVVDTAGTWSNSFTAGQRNGTTGGVATTNETVSDGYQIVDATGTYTAAKTGITSAAWDAAIATYKNSGIADGENATDLLGQYTSLTSPTPVTYTKSGGNNGLTALGLNSPQSTALDAVNHRLFVTDNLNNRVLVYNLNTDNSIPTASGGHTAANVLGQADLSSNVAATTQSGMIAPIDVAFDSANNRLFVADMNNNRVLVFNTSSITNGMNASYVLGQANFVNGFDGPTQSLMYSPQAISYDSANNRLFVADGGDNRVTVWNVAPGTIANGENASFELGQPSGTAFTTATATTSVSGMSSPTGVTYDSVNSRLFVADGSNHRALVFNVAPGTIANGMNASFVLGEPNFTTATASDSQSGLNNPAIMSFDNTNERLFVADYGNSRVVEFNVAPATIANGENASYVLGQTGFGINNGMTTQSGLYTPNGVTYDPGSARVFVSDSFNNRVMVFSAATFPNGENATDLLGQYTSLTSTATVNWTQQAPDNALISLGFNYPVDVAIDDIHHRLFVSDANNSRVLVYTLNNDNSISSRVPAYVLGQVDFVSKGNATNQMSIFEPRAIAYDAVNDRLFVTDSGGPRVLVFNTATITNGMNAAYELGQPSGGTAFTSQGAHLTASGFYAPTGIAYDPVNSRLFVSDYSYSRVTVFNVAPGTIANGEAASYVIGQTLFTTQPTLKTQSGLSNPENVAYDAVNSRLFVADGGNARVTVYNVAPGTIASGENASYVLGQANFVSGGSNEGGGTPTQSGMCDPKSLSYDATSGRLFEADNCNERVMVFNTLPAPIVNGMNASNVLGQVNFANTGLNTVNQSYMALDYPNDSTTCVTYDPATGRLFVCDTYYNRILIFPAQYQPPYLQ